ncbi:MAG: hypothetical protein RR704_06550 [Stenotrophomonas sp.]
MKVIVAAFTGMAMVSGCAMSGGDMIIRVSGKIGPSSQPYALVPACELSMLDESGRVVSSKPVAGQFSVPMMVVAAPQPARHHLIVQCNDGRVFDAQSVQISSRRDYPRAFDMGELPER